MGNNTHFKKETKDERLEQNKETCKRTETGKAYHNISYNDSTYTKYFSEDIKTIFVKCAKILCGAFVHSQY